MRLVTLNRSIASENNNWRRRGGYHHLCSCCQVEVVLLPVDCMHRRAHHISTGFPAKIKIRSSLLPAEITPLDCFLGLDLPKTVVRVLSIGSTSVSRVLLFPAKSHCHCHLLSAIISAAAGRRHLNLDSQFYSRSRSSSTIAARVATIGNHNHSEPSISKRRPCCCSSADPPQPSFGRCQSSGRILLLLLLRL